MLFKEKNKSQTTWLNNRHFIFIEVPFEYVAPFAIQWGQGEWWPEKCPLRFVKETQGETRVGSTFLLRKKNAKSGGWLVEVTNFSPNRLLEHTFRSGIFVGQETINIGERANGTRIDYELRFQVRGLINKLLWPIVFQKQHDQNVELILHSLKDFVLEKYHQSLEGMKTSEPRNSL
jgi:hypothetical protein